MPNPSNLQIRVGFEATEGLGDVSVWQDFRVRSESLGADFPTIQDDSIVAFAEEQEGLESKIDPSGDLSVNWAAEDHAKFLAAFQGKGLTPAEAPTGVWTHKLSPHETAVTFGTVALDISRDLGRPEIYVGGRPQQITFAAAPRTLLNGAISMLHPRFHTWKAGALVGGGSGTQTIPYVRGLPSYANLIVADGDLYTDITVAPSGGVMTVRFKVGAAGTFGTAIVVAAGTWYDVNVGASDTPAGTLDLPVQVMWASLVGVIGDKTLHARTRTVWTQSLPVSSALNEIACSIWVDGTKFRVSDFGATLTRPAERDEIIGGRFIDTVVEYGERTCVYTLSRRALDLTMVNKLWRAESVEFRMDAYGPLIGATASRRRLSLISKNCKPEGKAPSVGGKTEFNEDITLRAHPSDDATYPASVTIEVVNSQSSLA